MFVNYDENLLNYIASIRDYLGLSHSYQVDKHLTTLLNKKQFKQIVLLLVDGMGSRLIQRHLNKERFVYYYMSKETSTVFPPTTTAATLSVLNGKSPNETCWLGWIMHDKSVDDYIVPFLDCGYYSGKNYEEKVYQKSYPTFDMIDELCEKSIPSTRVYPSFDSVYGENDLGSWADKIIRLSNQNNYQFIYGYWDELDSVMHQFGPNAKESIGTLLKIDDELAKIAKKLTDDTLLMVIADHGQVEVEEIEFYNHPLFKYLSHMPSIEPRCTNFFVQEKYYQQFREEFIEEFENDFILLTKKQVLDSKLFGETENHPDFAEKIGDYIAIAKTNKQFKLKKSDFQFKGAHAGCCEDELMIPIIYYYKGIESDEIRT